MQATGHRLKNQNQNHGSETGSESLQQGIRAEERQQRELKDYKPTQPEKPCTAEQGGTCDSELMRAMKERDGLKSMLNKYKRHLSEIQANVRVLTAERDKTRMHYQQAQEEIAKLRRDVLKSMESQGSKYNATAQSVLKRLETERDDAMSNLHHMSTERDSLKERLKISQETSISERAHLEQRVEDLQNALQTLEQERAEHKSRQAQMREAMTGLEEQMNTLGKKLGATEGELSCLKNECSMLRLSNTQTENTLNETQKRLINRIKDLQRVQEKNKQLDEKNDSLLKNVTVLQEQMNILQNTVSELSRHRDTLQVQLERKNALHYSTTRELDDKENLIHSMSLQIEDLEADLEAAKEAVRSRDRELDVMKKKLLDSGDDLNAVLKLKDTAVRDNTQLREELDQVRQDNKALQFRVDEATHKIEFMERKVQNYDSDISNIEDLLSSKEQDCKELQECQMKLRTSASENRRLRERVASLESCLKEQREYKELQECRMKLRTVYSQNCKLKERVASLESCLKEAHGAEQSCGAELRQLKSTLEKQEEELRQVQNKQLDTHNNLEKTRDVCIKLDTEKKVVQQELESFRSELERLRKQLAIEREKEIHRQFSFQERLVEIQVLRDKLNVAECKASTQSREMAQLRTRSTLLESDLEATRQQLSIAHDEKERAVKELRRLGQSSPFGSPVLSSTLLTPPSPVHRSLGPHTSYSLEHLHHASPSHLPPRHSSARSV
ncbi:testis-specific gene 10 protein isoform X1 [Neoarius graeffei]|uniref:testis-specific gene 10 protein isoform X1 n=2 Tax=Neoarius graeffei TaxID=443677 RepID=UPI00298C7544|nr:testis-specific gene 10 protein isoform X1 [Neoarius graeffei]